MGRRLAGRALAYALLLVVAIVGFAPFVIIVILSTKSRIDILEVPPSLDFDIDQIVQNYQFRVPGALMQQDYQRLVTMLRRFDNVKVCISGHAHLVDDVVYEGKTYLCNGSVSGSWWHGPHKGCNPGYSIMKLWANGAFSRDYVEFEWRGE